ncbi:hypothetical protein NLM27_24345 [Bradyrhizobium sp. CCGB12]|uniref:hypothetical protein n=1 Tax=Bradyrhizobium sp. CCGB12 TaxID=2949632 RepID=UPI0020B43E9D|nr:hypothetical protein [Bradyrhizobium sp. CCGB12]MCP3391927.1 hypothetical protein [Bradyrhizobium sp. CCGB12]
MSKLTQWSILLAAAMHFISSPAHAQSKTIAQDIARRFAVSHVLLPFRPLRCENSFPACRSTNDWGAASSPILIAVNSAPGSEGSKLAPQLLTIEQADLCIRPAEVVRKQVSHFDVADLGKLEYPLSKARGRETLQELLGFEVTPQSEPSRVLLTNIKKQGDFEGVRYKESASVLCSGAGSARSRRLIVADAIVGKIEIEFPLRSAAAVQHSSASLLNSGFDETARTHDAIAYVSRYYYVLGFSGSHLE